MHSATLVSLPQLLITTILGIQSLGQQRQILDDILLTMSTIYDAAEPLPLTRKYFAAIFELDRAFSAAIPLEEPLFGEIIISLMITNAEFCSVTTQSARHIPESGAGTVEYGVDQGFVRRFPVDLEMLYEGQNIGSDKVSIYHSEIMLICQKAALRKAMLEKSLDSFPIFLAVGRMKDVVHIG